jgi:hypothetical protein
MENKKSKEDIQFEKDMAIIKKGGRIPYTKEEIKELDDLSKSGNPQPKKSSDKKTPKKNK